MSVLGKASILLVVFVIISGNASAIVVSGIETIIPPASWPEEPCLWPPVPWGQIDLAHENVGKVGGGSGIYLGNGWVLTARHIGHSSFTLGETTYYNDNQNSYTVLNPTGIEGLNSAETDLHLFHLTEEPDLPSVKIATEPPAVGSKVFMLGFGQRQSNTLSYWTLDYDGYIWTPSETPTDYWGYTLTSTREFSWGFNNVVGSGDGPTPITHIKSVNGIDIIGLKTIFNSQYFDSQAVGGDSGGAVFYQETSGDWVLGGIISSVEYILNTPTQALHYAATYSVALSFYEDQILSVITPAPIPGDANGDGVVDGSDVTILADNWQATTSAGASVGDFNGDGIVDGSDVTIIADNWQYGVSSQDSPVSVGGDSGVAVPEPSVWAMFLGMVLLGVWRFFRNRSLLT